MVSPLLRRAPAVLALAVVAQACSFGASSPSTTSPPATTPFSAPASEAAETPPSEPDIPALSQLPGLLVVEDGSDLRIVRPDGSGPIDLPGSIEGSQPSWSADGTTVAWSTVRPSGTPAVAVSAIGSEPDYLETGFLPFYISWSPSGSHLGVLGNGASGTIEFALIEPTAATVRSVDSGAPFYFDWSPDGTQIVAHVGESELRVIEVATGSRLRSVPATGEFQAPQWIDEGIVYQDSTPKAIQARGMALQGSTTQRLLVGDIDSSDREIARFDGFGAFAVSMDRVAYSTGSGLDLWVVEAGADPVKVNDDPVLAFQWSPDGTRLLSLEFDPASAAPSAHWVVWTEAAVMGFPDFQPSGPWISRYLPFWDQYNRSLSVWSPDGTAFVYTAVTEQGAAEVLVQMVAEDLEPVAVASGEAASWSR